MESVFEERRSLKAFAMEMVNLTDAYYNSLKDEKRLLQERENALMSMNSDPMYDQGHFMEEIDMEGLH